MRASVVVAGHNEGENLLRTIQSIVGFMDVGDCEIIVSDDASTDQSIERCVEKFRGVTVVRNAARRGPSPTKDAGTQRASGEVLIFLDGHCNPEPGALDRLVDDVERSGGGSIFMPRIAALDTAKWRNQNRSAGDGYAMDLMHLDSHWMSHSQMQPHGPFFESPALIGCCFAVSRSLYWKLWGFDPHMC